jgi:1,6-anhydro-N-acetylmuramate kinase
MLPRQVEAEWLDQLPADDPRAVRSRHDLVRLNSWMLQGRIMARALLKYAARPPRRLLDLGGGDGSFMLGLARRLASRWSGLTVTLLDRKDIVSHQTRAAFAALGWNIDTISADVFEYFETASLSDVDIITANLFLHHFSDDQLRRLLALAARTSVLFVACEPRRSKFTVEVGRMVWVIGCNDVTVHDGVASARAGFSGRELSALWPSEGGRHLREHAAGLFSHCFVARPAMPER